MTNTRMAAEARRRGEERPLGAFPPDAPKGGRGETPGKGSTLRLCDSAAGSFLLCPGTEQDREGVAAPARADLQPHVAEAGLAQQLLELRLLEAEPDVAEPVLDPLLAVRPQVEEEQLPAGDEDALG